MVAELVQHITAVRHDAPLYHWRDATGHEIDVLIDADDRLIPVEVKSAVTIAATACDTINWWTSLPGNPNRGGVLVRGGDRSFDLTGASTSKEFGFCPGSWALDLSTAAGI